MLKTIEEIFKDWTTTERQLQGPNSKNSHQLDFRFDSIAFLAKSLSDENRLRVLLCIGDEKKSVSRIVEELKLSQPLVSHHLKELKRSLLVQVERNGPFIYYEIADHKVLDIIKNLDAFAKGLLAQRNAF
ncbi:MAG: winged helix-turn-helix transcriptional regulator [Deltaproteobacteria bacterium]|nr:winged helix-turn-helix transcriptional regulator [Deltaproteobacteria bacterium]